MARQPRPSRRRRSRPGRHGGIVWLYGFHPVRAALGNPAREIRRLLLARPELRDALGEVCPADPIVSDNAEIGALLPTGAVHQGFALETSPLKPVALPDLLDRPDGDSLLVVLDQITDPRNAGAILRSAAAFGAAAVIQQERYGAAQTGVLAKAASGALETVPLVRVVNICRALDQLQPAGFWRIGLDATATRSLDDPRPGGRLALVLGAEGRGLRRLTREHCDELAAIPMRGAVPSLNVSNAAAVALYALTRS